MYECLYVPVHLIVSLDKTWICFEPLNLCADFSFFVGSFALSILPVCTPSLENVTFIFLAVRFVGHINDDYDYAKALPLSNIINHFVLKREERTISLSKDNELYASQFFLFLRILSFALFCLFFSSIMFDGFRWAGVYECVFALQRRQNVSFVLRSIHVLVQYSISLSEFSAIHLLLVFVCLLFYFPLVVFVLVEGFSSNIYSFTLVVVVGIVEFFLFSLYNISFGHHRILQFIHSFTSLIIIFFSTIAFISLSLSHFHFSLVVSCNSHTIFAKTAAPATAVETAMA